MDARFSMVYRLTHPVHQRDLPTCPVAVQRPQVRAPMIQSQCAHRGHEFLPGWGELTAIPLLYETEGVPLEDKVIHLHSFFGGRNWYIAELDDDSWLAFGYANQGDPQNAEWGYVSLPELVTVTTPRVAAAAPRQA